MDCPNCHLQMNKISVDSRGSNYRCTICEARLSVSGVIFKTPVEILADKLEELEKRISKLENPDPDYLENKQ